MKRRNLSLLFLVMLLPACASNFNGQFQKVTIKTDPDRYSKCYMYMVEDIKFISAPTTMDLQRQTHPITLKCTTADGDAEGQTTVEPKEGEWGGVKGMVLGLGIGWLYDKVTDAAYEYPTPIIVPLQPKPPSDKKE